MEVYTMKKVFNRIKIILKEFMNILTNVLVPLLALLIAICEILPVPYKVIRILKVVEYWAFYAFGTAENIKKEIEKIEEKE
jgi:hypothetical protein